MPLSALPCVQALVPLAAQVFLLSLKLPTAARLPACCLALSIWLAVFFLATSTGNVFADYMLGTALCIHAINSVYLLLLSHPLDAFKLRAGSHGSRLHWVYTASISPRGIGWTTPAKNTPAARAQSRTDFVLSTVLRAVRQLLLFDAAQLYVCYSPVFAAHGAALVSVSASITSQGCLLRCASILAWGAMLYSTLNLAHSLFAAVSVALGLSEASSWPPLFGRWEDAYTLRRFWGRTWHQLLRQPLSAIAKAAARTLGFKPGSRGSSYVQLYLVFALSGAVHVGGDMKLNARHTGFSWPFFVLQAIAITLEDAVIGLAGFADATPLTRLAGYLWVWCWFYVSCPVWVDGQIAAGLGMMRVLPLSPIMAAGGLVGRLAGSDWAGSVLLHGNSSAVL
ncbi:membrane bound O-acyl transferase family-domain-containing protein [Hygrophoropsis aurantiaca]|uniref:Membrane bound O-acyl transferase family-domain-containing protein n=1 Tax=Hygrophoropsis aurantiaca TaxID=72124 RepID=A0ACB8A6L8_9AGAM|nr:membrane bound O-acyl transferase family-domain-containing protein [Hygrophoropsis aurantiaca]